MKNPGPGPMLGSHLSIAGSMAGALAEAEKLGLDSVQVFTKNQQQWRVPVLADGTVSDWKAELDRLGWNGRTVSHASYLINLASPDDELWRKSIDLMTVEIERCAALAIPFLVHHPGAYTTSTRTDGISRIAAAYKELFQRTAGITVVSCLENTTGSGSNLGREFAELAEIRAAVISATGMPDRIGYCLDTCHAHAGGYDMAGADRARSALDEFGRVCGWEPLKVLHMNDSKGASGSRLDRHEHIGLGTIGDEGFSAVVRHESIHGRPMILETPKGPDPKGQEWDSINVAKLRRLAGVGATVRPVPTRNAALKPVVKSLATNKPGKKPVTKSPARKRRK